MYEVPPSADNDAVCPAQMVEVPDAVIVGIGTTVMVIVLVPEHPAALAPVTV